MQRIKVLILHRHVLVRQMISDVLKSTGNFEIVEVAAQDQISMKQIQHCKCQVALIDVNDDQGRGLQLISQLKQSEAGIHIIALSPRNHQGAHDAFKALRLGALDYITVTERPGMLLFADNHLKKRLLPILKTVGKNVGEQSQRVPKSLASKEDTAPLLSLSKPELLVVGGCLGGPLSLFHIISEFRSDFPVPILVTLHMPKKYTDVFAEELDALTTLDVRTAEDGEYIQPGQVRIAPGGYHMTVKGPKEHAYLHVHRGSHENKCRPSIDALFRSAAEVYGPHLLAYVLSGRGRDGVFGARKVAELGGKVLLNDPQKAIEPEMLLNIIKAHIDYQVVPLAQLVDSLNKILEVQGIDTSLLIPKSNRTDQDSREEAQSNN
ncbi:MAG: chemotaxis protein CheB [Bacteroidota bacterium]